MKGGMRTAVATLVALLYVCALSERWLEGQAQGNAQGTAQSTAQGTTQSQTPTAAKSPQRALVDQYCVACHNEKLKSGGLTLSALNLDAPDQSAEVAEKVIRKLRGGLMPPAGAKRPDAHAAAEFVSFLETKIDSASTVTNPGRVALRRLNRREYGYAIRDLLGLNIDATAWLPDDNIKGNFDNNAAALQVSPNFIDQYIYAARAVALEAIGNPKALAETTTYGDVANMVISLPPQGAPGTGRQQHRL
jgi:mono/diheme cytochrome c family protein